MPYKDKDVRRKRQREYSRRWYLSHLEHVRASTRKRKQRERARWEDYRSKQSCTHCGFSHPAAIDFHHVIRQGKQSVNDLVVRKNNIDAAIREAEEKCIPLCANCHRILHWEERRRIKSKRKKKAPGDAP